MIVKQVSEIMIYMDEYPMVHQSASIKEAIELMLSFKIKIGDHTSLPRIILVLDKKDCLVGLVRRRDLMKGLEPDFLKGRQMQYRRKLFDVDIDPNLFEMSIENFVEQIKKRAEDPVSSVMITNLVSINYDDSIFKAVNVMVEKNITLLPVINNGKVVGVIRTVDVFNELAKLVVD